MPNKPIQRTDQQNKALHLYFEMLAEELNSGGLTVQMVMKEKMELDWTKIMVKELLWKSTQKTLLGTQSTKDLAKQEDIDTVYDHLNRHLSEKFGVHVPFPSHEVGYWDKAPLIHEKTEKTKIPKVS